MSNSSTKSYGYDFSNDWFKATAQRNFEWLFPKLRPVKILEVGSFEGASTCFMIQYLANVSPIEIHCIDTWMGGQEHAGENMGEVEKRFLRNTELAIQNAPNKIKLVIHKGYSERSLSLLLASNITDFDFVYIDGSHEAPDVITDAILSFKLLKPGGVLGFDDYTWGMDNILMSPKLAIDSFINIYSKQLKIININPYQIYIQKTFFSRAK